MMQIRLSPIRDNKQTEYHVIDDSRLVIDGIVYDISKGAAWPNACDESGGNICAIEDGAITILYRYGKDGSPSDCGPFDVASDGFDAKGLPVVTVSAQSAEEVATTKAAADKAAVKAQAQAEIDALETSALRPLIAISSGKASKEDEAKLAEIKGKIDLARGKLSAEVKGGLK